MGTFEDRLASEKTSVERFVRFRIGAAADAEDVIQENFLTASRSFHQLKNPDAFRAWLIAIARHKCNDYYRQKAARPEIPLDYLMENYLTESRFGPSVNFAVHETLEQMRPQDRAMLQMFYWQEMSQSDISAKLQITVGTVKSRLHTARQSFKSLYPRPGLAWKGEHEMNKMPKLLPDYRITPSDQPPFPVKWEELMGWFLVPKLGEQLQWGMYDLPSRQCCMVCSMKVTGKSTVHGIEGVSVESDQMTVSDKSDSTKLSFEGDRLRMHFIAQLTDTHCRYLATMRQDGDTSRYFTFLDGDDFLMNWGFGPDNCGNETDPRPKGDIRRNGAEVTAADKEFLLDVVGQYTVTIGGKSYDTICIMDIETYNGGVASEQFLDASGRTILWRRFNRDDWAVEHYKKPWSQQLPGNERLIINGQTYVHWYDCITDRILK